MRLDIGEGALGEIRGLLAAKWAQTWTKPGNMWNVLSVMSHMHQGNCKLKPVPGYTGQLYQGKPLGKVCALDPQELAFARDQAARFRKQAKAAKAKRKPAARKRAIIKKLTGG